MDKKRLEVFLESAEMLWMVLEDRMPNYHFHIGNYVYKFQEIINNLRAGTDDGLKFFQEVDMEARKLCWMYDKNPKDMIKPSLRVFYLTAIQNVLKIPYLV